MTPVTIALFLIFSFTLGSVTYVYLYRGKARYASLGEYLTKGWPIFTPLNCLLYMFTQPRARQPILDLDKFHELDEIRNNWETIREEVLSLYQQQYFEQTKKPGSQASYDIGFRTFFKYGWSKFYINWYGYSHDSAKKLCPNTVRILLPNSFRQRRDVFSTARRRTTDPALGPDCLFLAVSPGTGHPQLRRLFYQY